MVDAVPWPNVRGKRCLALVGVGAPDLGAEIDARGAASVDSDAADGILYDVVMAWGVLAPAADPGAVAAQLRSATRGVAVSVEPIDLRTSVLARGRPLFSPTANGHLAFNGAGHRHLLEDAGFAIERVGRPFAIPDSGAPAPGLVDGLLLRFLTGTPGGRLHRALLVRPRA